MRIMHARSKRRKCIHVQIRSATLSLFLFLLHFLLCSLFLFLPFFFFTKTRINRLIYSAVQTCCVPKKERHTLCYGTWNAAGCLSHAQSTSIQTSPLSTGLTSALSFPFLPRLPHTYAVSFSITSILFFNFVQIASVNIIERNNASFFLFADYANRICVKNTRK